MSIKRRLFLLLLVALLPLLAFELLTQIHLRIEREAEIRQEATRLLDLLVTEQQRIVADIRGDLHTIADSGVARHGWADCQSFLDRLRRRYPGYLDIEVADTEGVIRCSTEARSIGAAVADLRSFRDALRSSDLIVGAGERRPRRGVEETTALPFRLGLTAPDGARAGVLTVHLDIRWLGEHLGRKPMPPNTAILVADSIGTVLARVPEIPGLVGSTLPDRFRRLIDRGAAEVVTMDGLDHIPRLVALMPPSPGMPNMTLELGLSLTDAMRPVDRAAIRALAGFATVMLLSGGAAAWGVQQVVRARERATKAQRRMALVLDSTTDAVFELDRQWRFTAMNDRAKTAVAAGRDLIGEVLWDALPEARAAAAWGRFHEAVATGAPVEYEARTPQGRWFAVRAFPTDEGLAVYCQDITARREAEDDRARLLADLAAGRRDLEAKQRLLEAVLRATPSGLIAVEGPSGRLLLRNDEAERLIGHPVFPAEGVRDYSHHGAIHADGTPYRPEDYPIARALRLGAEVRQEEMRYRRGDGQVVTLAVSTAPVRDETGRVGLAVSSFTDITERKRMEDALRGAEQRVRAVVEEAPVMMWVNHADGSFDFSNAVWRAYTGATPSDGVRWEYVHPDDRPRVEQLRAGAIAAGKAYAFEMRLRRTDGAYRWHLGRVRPLVDDGRITAWIGTATDVHDLREAREEADRANVAKSKFLAAASHDLRQPLQSLFLFAAGLHGHVPDERGKRALTMLERNLDALKGLLESLLDVSRLDAAATRPDVRNVAVGPLLDEIGTAFGPIARAKGLAIEVDATCPAIVRSDRNLLGRMVRNLVENAIKYTERGSVRLVCREDGDRAILEVEDTGIGIPAEQLNAVFEEFHQVDNPERDRHKGLGLGLSIVRRLSAILNHHVQVRSNPGQGSTFTVSIPLGTVDAEPPPPEAAVVPLGRGRLAVLVDDNADVLAGMRDMFLDWGFEVITAASAGEVEQRLGSNGGTPSVIVTDYRLGGYDDGLATIDRVRRRVGSAIPAVVLTGDTEADVHRSAIGRRAVLTIKPVTAGQMNDALRRALGEGA